MQRVEIIQKRNKSWANVEFLRDLKMVEKNKDKNISYNELIKKEKFKYTIYNTILKSSKTS